MGPEFKQLVAFVTAELLENPEGMLYTRKSNLIITLPKIIKPHLLKNFKDAVEQIEVAVDYLGNPNTEFGYCPFVSLQTFNLADSAAFLVSHNVDVLLPGYLQSPGNTCEIKDDSRHDIHNGWYNSTPPKQGVTIQFHMPTIRPKCSGIEWYSLGLDRIPRDR